MRMTVLGAWSNDTLQISLLFVFTTHRFSHRSCIFRRHGYMYTGYLDGLWTGRALQSSGRYGLGHCVLEFFVLTESVVFSMFCLLVALGQWMSGIPGNRNCKSIISHDVESKIITLKNGYSGYMEGILLTVRKSFHCVRACSAAGFVELCISHQLCSIHRSRTHPFERHLSTSLHVPSTDGSSIYIQFPPF
jgi:hypothetical protein